MTEPRRLLDGDATDFERNLLQSMAKDAPSSRQQLHMVRALCIVGPVLWTARVKAAVAGARDSLWSAASVASTKSVIGIVLAGLAGSVAFYQYQLGAASPNAPSASPSDAVSRSVAESSVAESSVAESSVAESSVAESSAAAEPSAVERTQAPEVVDNSLRAEILLLDRAREALQSSSVTDRGTKSVPNRARQGAAAALKEYFRRFPDGVLKQDAKVLQSRWEELPR